MTVAVYLNLTYVGTAFFYYSDGSIATTNSILLYNLSPGSTGFFKNISVCAQTCDCKILGYLNIMFSLFIRCYTQDFIIWNTLFISFDYVLVIY